jgi:hypothetical protein
MRDLYSDGFGTATSSVTAGILTDRVPLKDRPTHPERQQAMFKAHPGVHRLWVPVV